MKQIITARLLIYLISNISMVVFFFAIQIQYVLMVILMKQIIHPDGCYFIFYCWKYACNPDCLMINSQIMITNLVCCLFIMVSIYAGVN